MKFFSSIQHFFSTQQKLWLIGICSLVLSCSNVPPPTTNTSSSHSTSKVQAIMTQSNITVDPKLLRNYVELMVNRPQPRSFHHPASLNQAADLLVAHFKRFTPRVSMQPYSTDFGQTQNVIASFGPEQGTRIIIGAHYDVYDDLPGADDNASAVAGLMALAQLLADNADKLTKRIDIVAYSLEEPPYFRTESMGSYVHAKSLKNNNVDVTLMVCLEMIGYFTDAPNSQEYPIPMMKWFYPTVGNFIGIISNFSNWSAAKRFQTVMRQSQQLPVERLAAPRQVVGVDFSDHQNYWRFDYPAIMVSDTAFFRNPNYHQPTDTPDTLNYEKMAQTIIGVYHGVMDLM